MLREMREKGEVDAQIYAKMKSDMSQAKKAEVQPRAFPAAAE